MKTKTEKCTGPVIAKLLCKEALLMQILEDIEKEQTDKYIKIKNQVINEPEIMEIVERIEKAREATKRAEAKHAKGEDPTAEAITLVMTRLRIKELIKNLIPEDVKTFLNTINNN